ncbi:Serine/threonine-protein kinase PknB [Symmachiella dynata]|uniref:WD40 repeat domain-containing serine/threonine-protein kinase n=1 Tax=Symmachiella dynata TaxID=2527995 RepID=UPI00118A3748|nr:WD40 repeat domain-containing serine/threonine-protein kinase [Symmachiella dynata]QDT51641.1 Serine/threonine-protein kinase PknB [Symmachiella dynata]
MSINSKTKHLFDLAVEIPDPQKQALFLEVACADNHAMRTELEELLRHDAAENNPLDAPLAPSILGRFRGLQPGTMIGPYKIREQIGEGGFGEVYVAEQTKPIRRKVALKLIKLGMESKNIVGRFESERQALAMMDHPHVAKVLDAGTAADGRPYFVMELVKGTTITKFCDQHKLSTDERLRLFIDTCHAVQHAHQKGIIHRDLKPSNIMVTTRDEIPIVKVIDFGVAKALSQPLTEMTVYTAFGQMIGTPMYMSPEQAQLNEVDVDTRSDVYALGVLLYELLTGTTPFNRETLESAGFDEMRRIILEDEPPKPSSRLSTLQMQKVSTISDQRKVDHRKLGRKLQGELDWIVMRALEKDRNRRYESPREFAEDINRYLKGQAVKACPPSVTYRLGKFAKRHRGKLTSIALLLVTLCAFGSWELLQSRQHLQEMGTVMDQLRTALAQVEEEKRASDKANQLTQQVATRARQTSYLSQMKLAFQRYGEGRLMEASQILADQMPATDEPDLRHVEWNYLNSKLNERFRVIGMHSAGVQDLAIFPDGKRVASAGMDGVVSIWDIRSATRLKHFKLHHRPIHAVAISPDGRWIAYGEEDYPYDSHVVLIDAMTGDKVARLNKFPYTIRSLDFSGDGKYLVSASAGAKEVVVWEFENGFQGKSFRLAPVTYGSIFVDFIGAGYTLMVPNPETKSIGLWNVSLQSSIDNVNNPSRKAPLAFAYNASQQFAAYLIGPAGKRGRVDLVDAASGTRLNMFDCNGRERLVFSDDGSTILIGSYNGWIESSDIVTADSSDHREVTFQGKPKIRAVNGAVTAICTLNSEMALVSGTDGAIVLYRFGQLEPEQRYAPEEIRVTNTATSNDSKFFAWLGTDDCVRLTDYESGKLLATSEKLPHFARTLVFSPCGSLLAAQCDNKHLQYWDVSQGDLQSLGSRNFGHSSGMDSAWGHVAIDQQHVIGFGEELDNLYFLNTQENARFEKQLPNAFASSVLLSPDNRIIAASNLGVQIFDRATLKAQGTFVKGGHVFSMAYSPDSRWLASGHKDGAIHLGNVSRGDSHFRLNGHNYAVRALTFSRDGARLISGDGDGYLGFWDVKTGKCYGLSREFSVDNQRIRKLSLGPSEQWLDVTAGHRLKHRWTKRVPLRPSEWPYDLRQLENNSQYTSRAEQQPKLPGQLAYNGFEYPVGSLTNQNGGHGFRRGWTALSNLTKPSNAEVVDLEIENQGGHFHATGHSILMQGKDTLSRSLAQKIDLSQTGEYYISLLANRLPTGKPASASQQELAILLMNKENMQVVQFGLSSGRTIFMRQLQQGQAISQGTPPKQDHVADDIAYLLLMHIQVTSDAKGQNLARCRVAGISSAQTFPRSISEVKWSSPALDIRTDITFDRLRITNRLKASFLIDELKIGTTYESVTGAWP